MNTHRTGHGAYELHVELADDSQGVDLREVDEVKEFHEDGHVRSKKCEQVKPNYSKETMASLVKRDAFKKTNESSVIQCERAQGCGSEIPDSNDGENSSVGLSSTSTRANEEMTSEANSDGSVFCSLRGSEDRTKFINERGGANDLASAISLLSRDRKETAKLISEDVRENNSNCSVHLTRDSEDRTKCTREGVLQFTLADISHHVYALGDAKNSLAPTKVAYSEQSPQDEVAELREFLSAMTVFPGRNAREWCDINEGVSVPHFSSKQNVNVEKESTDDDSARTAASMS